MRGQAASVLAAVSLWLAVIVAAAIGYWFAPADWRRIGRENGALHRLPALFLAALFMAVLSGLSASGGVSGGSFREWLAWWAWMLLATGVAVAGFVVWLWRRNPEWFPPQGMSEGEARDLVSGVFTLRMWAVFFLWFASIEAVGYLLAGPRP